MCRRQEEMTTVEQLRLKTKQAKRGARVWGTRKEKIITMKEGKRGTRSHKRRE